MTLPLAFTIAKYPPYFAQARLITQLPVFENACTRVNQARFCGMGLKDEHASESQQGGPWNAQRATFGTLGWKQGMAGFVTLEL